MTSDESIFDGLLNYLLTIGIKGSSWSDCFRLDFKKITFFKTEHINWLRDVRWLLRGVAVKPKFLSQHPRRLCPSVNLGFTSGFGASPFGHMISNFGVLVDLPLSIFLIDSSSLLSMVIIFFIVVLGWSVILEHLHNRFKLVRLLGLLFRHLFFNIQRNVFYINVVLTA